MIIIVLDYYKGAVHPIIWVMKKVAHSYSKLKHENSHFTDKFDINITDIDARMILLGI